MHELKTEEINSFALGMQRNWRTFFTDIFRLFFLLSPLAVVFFGSLFVLSAARHSGQRSKTVPKSAHAHLTQRKT